ncbi:kinase-like domain-containing protein [Sparassis latifolia]
MLRPHRSHISWHLLLPAHPSRCRSYVSWQGSIWLFMEHVEGDDLKSLWPSLSMLRRLSIAWTLRSYIRQLRAVALPDLNAPGPFDGSGKSIRCDGHCFTEIGAGPFASYAEMSAWFARKRWIAVELEWRRDRRGASSAPSKPHFDDSMPLVLVHGDISLRNVHVGKDGVIWLLDWGFAGAYPPWFEYAGIVAYDISPVRGVPRSWLWLALLVAGWYKPQQSFIHEISIALANYRIDGP